MKTEDLEKASKLHNRIMALHYVLDNLDKLLNGKDIYGDKLIPDSNCICLIEEESGVELDFTTLNVGKRVIEAIKGVLQEEQDAVFKAVKEL